MWRVNSLRKGAALLAAMLAGPIPGAWAFGETAAVPADAPAIPLGKQLPSLGTDEKPAAPRWDRALPIGAQKIIDMGFELPNPYEIGSTFFTARQQVSLSKLEVAFNGGAFQDASFVGFPNTRVNNQAWQVQGGAWIFPFMSLFVLAGKIKGDSTIQVDVPGSGLADFVGLDLCHRAPALQPDFCSRTVTGFAKSTFTGTNYGVGTTLAGKFREIFVAIPIVGAVADVVSQGTGGGNKNRTRTVNVAPRLGMNFALGDLGELTAYGGGTYLHGNFKIDGTLRFDTSGTPIGSPLDLAYRIAARPADNWNYLAGAHWAITRNWSLMVEVGFGESRSNAIIAGFYRF